MGVPDLALRRCDRPRCLFNAQTMLRIKKYIVILVALFALTVTPDILPTAEAQCPMCRMSAESNLKSGGSAGRGLNRGILYMLAMPYLLVGTLGFVWWKNQLDGSQTEME